MNVHLQGALCMEQTAEGIHKTLMSQWLLAQGHHCPLWRGRHL